MSRKLNPIILFLTVAMTFQIGAAWAPPSRHDEQHSAGRVATQTASEYQRLFSDLLNSWKVACQPRNLNKMNSIRSEAPVLASGQAIGANAGALVDRMSWTPSATPRSFSDPSTPPGPVVNSAPGPSIRPASTPEYPINKEALTTVIDMAEANQQIAEALKLAVERWTFHPAVIDNQPCWVDTGIPMTLIEPR
jgi:hypothetical protein